MKHKKVWPWIFPAIIVIAGFSVAGFLNKQEAIKEEVSAQFGSVYIPDSLLFADVEVPLRFFDTRESLEREILVNSHFHSQTIRFIKLAPRYFSIIEPILKEMGIPDDFKYLAVAESNLDPKAVSPAKAVGMWQFLEGTAKEYGLEVTKEVDERYHVEKSTRAACRYLLKAYETFNDWALVAAAYNGGVNFIKQQMEKQKENNYFNLLLGEETERYLFRIMALKLVLENPEIYGFMVKGNEKYPIIRTVEVEVDSTVSNFADFAKTHETNYKILKYLNPWLREGYLTNTSGKKYMIKVPVEKGRELSN